MANDILRALEKYGRLRKSQFAMGPEISAVLGAWRGGKSETFHTI